MSPAAAPPGRRVYDHGRYLYVEIAAVLVFFALAAAACVHLAPAARLSPVATLLAALAGLVGADLVSGLVHWAGDTWGTEDWPVIGARLIGPFRFHHEDPEEITLHGFFAINGSNCLVSLPLLAAACAIPVAPGQSARAFGLSFLVSLCLWVLLTNQFHKWAHQPDPSWPVRLLQRMRLALPPEWHRIHHTFPFARHYCITTGWLNRPLDAIDFFGRLERLIARLAAAEPRAYMEAAWRRLDRRRGAVG